MVFSSLVFLFAFLPLTILLYYLTPRPVRNLVLFLLSLVFYGWGEPGYLILMVVTILVNYLFGFLVSSQRNGRQKFFLVLAIIVDLGILGTFKYAGFLARSLRAMPFLHGLHIPEIALPIGISFYIFQTMSYVIDVYCGEAELNRSLINFGTYVSMFPQLIAGPIVRYRDVAAQLKSRWESLSMFSSGVLYFICGLGKKVLLANQLGAMWDTLQLQPGTLSAWLGMFAYTLQIYFDFSGYSDMAIGLGRMFGFHFLKNFDYPYISCSVTEFWRRWHISLSTWFREYVYIPLGGNRFGLAQQLRNILIVWLLTGLWHGASWNFVFWGLYYALLLMFEKVTEERLLNRLPKVLRHAVLLLLVSVGWMLFYFDQLPDLLSFLLRLLHPESMTVQAWNRILAWLPLFAISCFAATPCLTNLFRRRIDCFPVRLTVSAGSILILLLCTAALVTQSYNPFIYFRF